MSVQTAAAASPTRTALTEPHHDGSDAYVLDEPQELGDEAVVRLRVPHGSDVRAVALRYVADGEARALPAELDEETATDSWWRVAFPVRNPVTRYRWLLSGGKPGYAWLNGCGVSAHDVTDDADFVASLDRGGPDWHLRSVVYEIFPDRFARSQPRAGEPAREAPEWAVPRSWNDLPDGRSAQTPREWFGGDLRGIEERLDHVEQLGADCLYLTPFFPGRSIHRYDATTFDHVDPLLGGDEALASLVAAAHGRGIRVVGDLTLNHTGDGHEWFRAARASADAPERGFYWFDDDLEHGYEAWLSVRTLPKLDHRSPELRRRLVDGPESVVRRWLRPPFRLDGWRVDVANMTARHRDVDELAAVAAAVRSAAADTNPDALLVAEHAHDARSDLRGGGWHGTMAYAGFTRPAWEWLRGDVLPPDLAHGFLGLPVGVPRLGGAAAAATMRAFRAGLPWRSVLHSWTVLDSHDTARFRTVCGSRERQLVGVGLQMTTPGVPMVFAGAELGLEGCWGEDARRPLPWHRPEAWDEETLAGYRRLIGLRRASDALARGGIRYVHVGADALAYLRETRGERLLCLASRAGHRPLRVPLAQLGARTLEPLHGAEAVAAGGVATLPGDGPAFHVWRLT